MRFCQDCKVEDMPVTNQDGEIVHEVNAWLRRIPRKDLTPLDELPQHWLMKGWQLRQDGDEFFRWKHLCRNCIRRDVEAQKMREAYQKACKAARGVSDLSYDQMMTIQSGS